MSSLDLYFDSAASSPLDEEVRDAMIESMGYVGNENSKHCFGFKSRQSIDRSLQSIANSLGVSPDNIAPTYSGTDSNRRIAWAMRNRYSRSQIFASAVEHSSIRDEVLVECLFGPDRANDPWTKETPAFLALMHANSETGTLYDALPWRQKFPKALILRDYSQSIAKGIVPDFEMADFGTFAPQKIYGPKGIGLLYLKRPQDYQEISKDTHTKNPFLIAGMAKAFEIWDRDKDSHSTQLTHWHSLIEEFVRTNIPDTKFHHQLDGIKGLLSIAFQGLRGSELMTILSAQEGIAISTGSACTSDILTATPVMEYVEKDPNWQYPIRISLHKHLSDDAINHFCEILEHYVSELRKR